MRYEFLIEQAAATIGFGVCRPADGLADADAVAYLEAHPMDAYMHQHLLRRILEMSPEAGSALVASGGPAMASVLAEAALLRGEKQLGGIEFAGHSPLVDLRQADWGDQDLHARWARAFNDNLLEHAPLPERCDDLPLPHADAAIDRAAQSFAHIAEIAKAMPRARKEKPVPVADTSRRAESALASVGVRLSQQMRHQASLAPVGLVRRWEREIAVENGALSYTLKGAYDSFGRGLAFDTAQAALLMEICERYSSWVSIGPDGPLGLAAKADWTRARFSELGPDSAVDPASFPIEAPYADEPLWWLSCRTPDGSKRFAPAQMLFLFANLDEQALFSGLGSTGLASGNSRPQARLGALMEVIERDAESTAPHDPARLFRISATDKPLAEHLKKLAAKGIDVLFEDITPTHGIPAYRAYAVGPEGQVAKGASASLCGARAAVSALLEVPYPFPFGPPSQPGPADLPTQAVQDLPDYSTGFIPADLALVESLLAASGRPPLYADLTRDDLAIPVCRALVPGLELMADFDRNSRLSPRLFGRWLGAY